MHDGQVAHVLETAAGRLAAYGYLLTGSLEAGDELVRAAVVKALVRYRRRADARTTEARVRSAMRTIHLASVRRRLPEQQSATRHPVGRALNDLTPDERVVTILRHYDDLSIPEIAAVMRTSEANAERLLAQALAKLSLTLGEIEPIADHIAVIDGSHR